MTSGLLNGRYKILQVLGAGGMARTFIAKDIYRPSHPKCVVKQLKPVSNNPNFLSTARNLFNREAKSLEELGHHPQIPRLLAHFEQDREFYLVQEFIEGHPLSAEIQPGQRHSDVTVIQLLLQVLPILEFVHRKGVIHRDIKPDNLIRKPDGSLVLIDFGAVREIKKQLTTSYPTEASVTIGTYGYMPTEQAQGKPRPNSDLYALGMVGISALTGLMPIQLPEDNQTGEVLWQHFVDVSEDLAAVLTKMSRYHFKDRYQTAQEALEAVKQLASGGNRASVSPAFPSLSLSESKTKTIPVPLKPSPNKNRIFAGLGVITAAAIVAIAAHAFSQASEKSSFGGDEILNVGVLTTKYNPQENYLPLIEHLQSQLNPEVKVRLQAIAIEEENALSAVRKLIKEKKWDLAFTTTPIFSALAVENDYEFAARMFPQASSYESALFVSVNSPIESIEDLKPTTAIALGNFNDASGFYLPIYDLYGKTLQLDLNNSADEIIRKVESREVDVGATAFPLVKENPNFRVISVSREIPLSGVYLAPSLSDREQNRLKNLLLNAPQAVQNEAKYALGEEVDYDRFLEITQRVESISGCTNWEKNPVNLFCKDPLNRISESVNEKLIKGEVNGFKLSARHTVELTLQHDDGQVYLVILPRQILDSDPNLPPLPAWNGKTIEINQKAKLSPKLSDLKLEITEPGQIRILE